MNTFPEELTTASLISYLQTELEACGTASFIGEVAKIIEARSHEIQRLHRNQNII
jgi:hypothetical protein